VWEPVGVVGMITPWNWPLNQIACKVFPALATGNTMVLKPSEIAPFNAYIFAEIMHAAGADLHLNGRVFFAHDRSVDRLVQVFFWAGDVVVKITRYGSPQFVNDPQDAVTLFL
jgi:acyl-CoA reductase-like NAD-dependent aldehyde dehydrogenase